MSEQQSLWGGKTSALLPATYPRLSPMVRSADGDTAQDAAVLAYTTAESLRAAVLEVLRAHGPMTDDAVAALLGRLSTSTGRRRLELLEQGLVEQVVDDDGKPARRLTRSGATAWVWRAT